MHTMVQWYDRARSIAIIIEIAMVTFHFIMHNKFINLYSGKNIYLLHIIRNKLSIKVN